VGLLKCSAAAQASSPTGAGAQIVSLCGSHIWTVSGATNVTNISATVPGQIHTDLLAAGVIDEPFYGAGDATLEWVAMSNWDYVASFSVPSSMLARQHVQLISLGIDTVADIFINGQHVFFSDNMFHRVRLDVKRFLAAGKNDIRVHFSSKPREANRRAAACDNATSLICPAGKKNPCQHPYDNVNYLRTEPCSFSWDWGPAFAPVGLWRPLYLQGYDSAVVRDITVVTTPQVAPFQEAAADEDGVTVPRWGKRYDGAHHPDPADAFDPDDMSEPAVIARAFRRTDRELDLTTWDIEATVFLDAGVSDAADPASSTSAPDSEVSGQVLVSVNTDPPITVAVPAVVGGAAGSEIRVPITIKGVKADAWFPNEFGTQPLYILSAKFVPDGSATTSGGQAQQQRDDASPEPFIVQYPLTDNAIKGEDGTNSVRFGFRKVELVQKPLPGGRSFYFSVNGVPLPVKGSNWIPADAFESRVSRDIVGTTRLDKLFVALKTSHQNMIRNWGGGIYQRDSFYDLADENGILIWEDLMWACAQYAVAPDYLESAAKEVQDNVRRLQSHPSIAL
jgi:beta-mannosidase